MTAAMQELVDLRDRFNVTTAGNAIAEADRLQAERDRDRYSNSHVILSWYCDWLRWRKDHGAISTGELELLEVFEASEAGQPYERPDHWVASTEEHESHLRGVYWNVVNADKALNPDAGGAA